MNEEKYIKIFKDYLNTFICEDEFVNLNIRLKEAHTFRVCSRMNRLITALDLSEKQREVAYIIALFHDFGRFKQIKKYKTFNDRESEDHALLSVNELKENKILESLSEADRESIFTSILNHNKYSFDTANLTEEGILYCNLIRDADKLDIFKVITDYYEERYEKPNDAIELGLKEEGDISKIVLNDVYNLRGSNNINAKNAYDMRIIRIAWVFDLNFKESLKIVLEKKYIEKILKTLPDTKEVKEVGNFILKYIIGKIV